MLAVEVTTQKAKTRRWRGKSGVRKEAQARDRQVNTRLSMVAAAPERCPPMQCVFKMTSLLSAAAFAAVATTTFATPAAAQNAVCGERSSIIERLESKYGESRVGLGVGRENGVVEVYTSQSTGSWTILMTMPTGMTCLMAAGEAWEDMADAATPTGDGA